MNISRFCTLGSTLTLALNSIIIYIPFVCTVYLLVVYKNIKVPFVLYSLHTHAKLSLVLYYAFYNNYAVRQPPRICTQLSAQFPSSRSERTTEYSSTLYDVQYHTDVRQQ
jgi:hypothetical protein